MKTNIPLDLYRCLVQKMAAECTDLELLDLVYKLLASGE